MLGGRSRASLARSPAVGRPVGSAGSTPSVDRIEGSFQGFLTWGAATLVIGVLVLGLASGSVFPARVGGPLVGDAAGSAVGLTVTEQEAARDAAAQAALWSFFALIIGAAGSIGGGYLGVAHAKRLIAASGEKPGTSRKGAAATA
jgi:hypothetical protein